MLSLTRATAISPGYAFAHYVRSQVLIFAGQLPQAIEAAQTAVLEPYGNRDFTRMRWGLVPSSRYFAAAAGPGHWKEPLS
jgi:hypothetical protein